ncbi:MAG: hypothetical protein KDJ83_11045, partial [Rhodobacteraceae bacterium]|nr:hypothetical protein [Paracoccaceae bacterium]
MVVRRGGLIRRMVRRALRWAAFAVLVVAVHVLALRWVNPPVTWLMASEWWRLGAIEREWRALPAMSPYLPLS